MNDKEQIIEVDGESYEVDKFDDNQRYLLAQIEDLTKRSSSIKFQLDQLLAAKEVFSQNLVNDLKAKRAEEVA